MELEVRSLDSEQLIFSVDELIIKLDRYYLVEASVDLQKQAIGLNEFMLDNTAITAHLPESSEKDTVNSEGPGFAWPDTV
ncbi:hypothetical protein OAE93_00370 [bacterium]|nr:hypothetical protein [bacterium]